MGWFDAPNYEGVKLGDEVLDEAYAFWKRLSAKYEHGIGRKPTLEELRALLETSLRVSADDALFSNAEEMRVSALQIKTTKRPKRQEFGPGDVFAIPLPGGRFAFGRIIHTRPALGTITEVFRATAANPEPSAEVAKSGRLFSPVLVNGLRAFRDWGYTIVAREPDYVPQDLEEIHFRMGTPGDYRTTSGTGAKRTLRDEEAEGFEPAMLWEPESLTKRVEGALDGTRAR